MMCPPLSEDPVVRDWIARHRSPLNLVLHVVGIPMTIFGAVQVPIYVTLLSVPTFLLALTMFLGGFGVQFLGHALDGTEPGEWTLLKKLWSRRAAAPAELSQTV